MKKFVAVESLRGWMAWWVVLGHALHLSATTGSFERFPLSLLPAGGFAVNVFMVISGFVIAHLLLQGRESYGQYLFRRGWRLLPLMMAMVLVAIAIRPLYENAYILNPFLSEHQMRAERFRVEIAYWPQHIIAHLTMLHGALPEQWLRYSSTSYLAPAWSISLEWQFYIIAPLLLAMLTTRTARSVIMTAITLAISALSLSGKLGAWQTESFLPQMLSFFLIGMTLRLIFKTLEDGGNPPYQALFITGLSVVALILLSLDNLSFVIIQLSVVSVAILTFFVIAAVEGSVLRINSRVFDRFAWLVALNPAIIAIGRVSYSTYLVHIPVFSAVVGTRTMLGAPITHASLIVWTGLAVLLTLPASFLCYRFIEAPSVALGKQFFRKLPADIPQVAG